MSWACDLVAEMIHTMTAQPRWGSGEFTLWLRSHVGAQVNSHYDCAATLGLRWIHTMTAQPHWGSGEFTLWLRSHVGAQVNSHYDCAATLGLRWIHTMTAQPRWGSGEFTLWLRASIGPTSGKCLTSSRMEINPYGTENILIKHYRDQEFI